MNNADMLFNFSTVLALLAWVYLVLFPSRPFTHKMIMGAVVALLALLYASLLLDALPLLDFASFKSLNGWTSLIQKPGMALLLWVHILAFNLLAGVFIAANAAKHGIGYFMLLPCFIFTATLGPVGFILYLLVRWNHTRNYFSDNF